MRPAETRISILLLAAIMIVVGAAYWLVLRDEPHTPWVFARGGLLVGGAAICVLLGVAGLNADTRRHRRRRLLDTARQWVLSTAGAIAGSEGSGHSNVHSAHAAARG